MELPRNCMPKRSNGIDIHGCEMARYRMAKLRKSGAEQDCDMKRHS